MFSKEEKEAVAKVIKNNIEKHKKELETETNQVRRGMIQGVIEHLEQSLKVYS